MVCVERLRAVLFSLLYASTSMVWKPKLTEALRLPALVAARNGMRVDQEEAIA
jgi:hypothetical protein